MDEQLLPFRQAGVKKLTDVIFFISTLVPPTNFPLNLIPQSIFFFEIPLHLHLSPSFRFITSTSSSTPKTQKTTTATATPTTVIFNRITVQQTVIFRPPPSSSDQPRPP